MSPSALPRLIFDIDGTLIDSVKAAGETYRQALLATVPEAEIKPNWSDYQNVTDSGIMIEVLEGSSRSVEETLVRFEDEFMTRLHQVVATSPYAQIPGAADFLDYCRAHFSVGIATGCWQSSGLAKLASAGILADDIVMASSSDYTTREDILQHCYRELGGPGAPVIYFGDAIWDVRTTQNLGWTMIGIGEKVRKHCDYWFPDYRRPDEIIAAITAISGGV